MRVAPHLLHHSATFETWIGISLSMMPPCIVAPRGFWCRFTTLITPVAVTITFSRSGSTCVIVPRLPMSLPASTTTSSPLRSFIGYNTSGASETIRMNLRSRSSRPTGPKMRVPRGCIWSLMSTAAFSSKRM